MRTTMLLGGLLIGALALSGCDPDRGRYTITLDPDGSGRVRVERLTGGADAPGFYSARPEDAEARARFHADRVRSSIEGVRLWTDLRATPLEGGRTLVEGTAWFDALGHVRLPAGMAFETAVEGDAMTIHFDDPTPDRLARLVGADRERAIAALDQDDAAFEATRHRVRGFIELWLAEWSFDAELRLPGPIREVAGFTRAGNDTVTLHEDAATALTILDRDLALVDEARQAVRRGEASPEEAWQGVEARLVTAAPCVVTCTLPREAPPRFDPAAADRK